MMLKKFKYLSNEEFGYGTANSTVSLDLLINYSSNCRWHGHDHDDGDEQ